MAGVKTNEWYHYCLTWDSSTRNIIIYYNGVAKAAGTRQSVSGRKLSTGGTVILGQDQDKVGGSFSSSQLRQSPRSPTCPRTPLSADRGVRRQGCPRTGVSAGRGVRRHPISICIQAWPGCFVFSKWKKTKNKNTYYI